MSVIVSPTGAVADAWPPGLRGAGGTPVVLMMPQRTCRARADDPAEANVVRSVSAAATVMTALNPQNRLLRRMISPFTSLSLVNADLAVHDLLDRQIEEERRQQRQVQ